MIPVQPALRWSGMTVNQTSRWRVARDEARARKLARRFPCLGAPPFFVGGLGEYLPSPPLVFDTVLRFGSLNHAVRPEAVLREAHRVLKTTGWGILALADMEPGWLDWSYFRSRYQEEGLRDVLDSGRFAVKKELALVPTSRIYSRNVAEPT